MTHPEPLHLIGATRDELRAFVERFGQPPYRADQVLHWIYAAGTAQLDAMTNLPKSLRTALAGRTRLFTSTVAEVHEGRDGTTKLLIALHDAQAVEAVIIPKAGRHTVCISTQVGCPIGCVFCASGLGGKARDLTAGEIVEQVLHARRHIEAGGRLTNIVVMGVGEPLLNFEAVVRALRTVTAPWGLAFSPRRITLSTVGLPGQIRRLAHEGPHVNLAVSLHAADDATRRRLIPAARPIRKLVEAARDYLEHTGREVTFEYVLIDGVNDSPDDARGLAEWVGGQPIFVNLLPLNPVEGLPWREPPHARVAQFEAELRRRRVQVRLRRRRGGDVAGACGQLRHRRSPT